MNFHLLEVFAAVCECQGVTRAAEKLHMTQPAVTQAIKNLERDSKVILFDRLSKRLHLTEAGKLYLEKTKRLLELCGEMEHCSSLEKQARLRVGSCITIACFWLPKILKRFESRGGDAAVSVASANAIMAMLADNLVDLALYEGPEPNGPYLSIPFSSYRLVPVCSRKHAFARRKIVPLTDLLQEKLLLREPGSAIRDVFDSFLRLRQLRAEPALTSVNSQAIIQSVKTNLGVSLLPDAVVSDEVKKGTLTTFEVKGMRLENENRIVFHADKHQSDPMRLFIESASRT